MMSVKEELANINRQVRGTISSLEQDPNVSKQLNAVMQELYEKSRKALSSLDDVSETDFKVREVVVELEQAADSAKAVAKTEKSLAENNRQKILEAHDRICTLKSEL